MDATFALANSLVFGILRLQVLGEPSADPVAAARSPAANIGIGGGALMAPHEDVFILGYLNAGVNVSLPLGSSSVQMGYRSFWTAADEDLKLVRDLARARGQMVVAGTSVERAGGNGRVFFEGYYAWAADDADFPPGGGLSVTWTY